MLGTGDTLLTGTGVDAVGRSAASAMTRCTCTSTAAARSLLSPPLASNASTSLRILAAATEISATLPVADASPFASVVKMLLAGTLTAVECGTQWSQWVRSFGRDSARRPALVC